MSFVHLHVHSEFSFHAGVPKIRDLVLRAKAMNMAALALTDTDRMSGLIVFYKLCLEQGIKPILGVELTDPRDPHRNVVLLAKDAHGYGDICEIVTRRHMDGDDFSVIGTLRRHHEHLFMLTNDSGFLKEIAATPNRENLFGELICQHARTRVLSREVEHTAKELSIPLAVTNNTFFLDQGDDWETHRILRAIGMNSTLSRLNDADIASPQAFFKSAGEIKRIFPRHQHAIMNTVRIAETCNIHLKLGKWMLPRIMVPEGYTPRRYLRKVAFEGLEKNYRGKETYSRAREIQEMELRVIEKLGYPSYFLMVRMVRDWASRRYGGGFRRGRDCTLMRGSAANSITFYNIGASDLDPIRYNLYFQRFLNEDRASPPDADLDFGWDERDDVFDFFKDTWGREHVAVICTTNHMKERAAFRETAKVMGYSEEQVSEIMDRGIPPDDIEIQKILGYADRVRGKPRFLGQHPGGVIVTNDPVCRHVACEYSGGPKNRVITQIDMHNGVDDLGLIKFDILGNGSLSVLRDTLAQLEEQGRGNPRVYDDDMCHNDTGVLDMIARGRTRGIFYIESPAQIRLNKKAQAASFEEIGITSSAVRPAGAATTKIFVERHRKDKQGVRDWDFLHPSLASLLDETHDCLVFQEDVIKVCHEIAGFSFKEADRVRKMMNSLHEGEPDDYEIVARRFIRGCMHKRGLTEKQAVELWSRVASFSGYSFCKSHSLSFAQLSFKCAYLKRYYPAQFLAAVVSNNHGFYSREVYLDEARRFNIKINAMDINISRIKYTGRGGFITPGLMHIRSLSTRTQENIVEEGERNGRYRNLLDFIERTAAGRREIESMIKVGLFDGFNMNQPELLSLLDGSYGNIRKSEDSLFGYDAGMREELHPGLSDFSLTRKCLNELEFLGFMLSGNILDILDLHPCSRDAVPSNEIHRYMNRRIKIFGWPITARPHHVPGRGPMKFITVEDKTECTDVVLWPEVYERYRDVTMRPGPYEIWGRVQEEWGTYTLIADSMRDVAWSPAQVDFEKANKRLLNSYNEEYVYADVKKSSETSAA
jgi:DNA-directed DNA polymerase III PolC